MHPSTTEVLLHLRFPPFHFQQSGLQASGGFSTEMSHTTDYESLAGSFTASSPWKARCYWDSL